MKSFVSFLDWTKFNLNIYQQEIKLKVFITLKITVL